MAQQEKTRYSDAELAEFKELILHIVSTGIGMK